jgi:outer membrane protein TolC
VAPVRRPRLDTLIETALAANTDLRVAEANLQRTQALLRDSETRQVQGGFSAETGWTQRSAEQVLSHTQPSEKETYDLGLSVSYDLDLFGALRRGSSAPLPTAKPRRRRAIWSASMSPPKPRATGPTCATPGIRPMSCAA